MAGPGELFDEADPQTSLRVSRGRYARPSREAGKKILLLGIIPGDRTYRIKGPLVIAPRCLLSKVRNEVYNSQWP